MSADAKVQISPRIFWVAAAISAIPLVVVGVPNTYKQIVDARTIDQYGSVASGIVIKHEQISGGGSPGCKSRVTISYTVAGKPYTLTSTACGTSPGALPLGRSIDVRYMPSSPSNAVVGNSQFDFKKSGWGSLALEIAIPFMLGGLGWVAQRQRSNQH